MLTAMTSPLPMAVTCAFVLMETWDVRGWNVLLKVRYTHDLFRQNSEVGENGVPVGNSSINPKSQETFSHALAVIRDSKKSVVKLRSLGYRGRPNIILKYVWAIL